MNPWQRRERAVAKRKELRQRVVEFLGGRCRVCGYNDCVEAMDAHHTDPTCKDFNISSIQKWSRLEQELKKCALLCARCHRELHAGHHQWLLAGEESHGLSF